MVIIRNILLFLLGSIALFSSQIANGQLADSTRIIVQDGFIEKMDNNIIFKVGLNNKYETFSQRVGDNYEVKLYPNIATNFTVGIDYRFISAGFQITPNFFPGNGDDETYGSTKSLSFGMSTIFNHWAAGFDISNVKGYYLYNTPSLFSDWQVGDPYRTFPKYETFTYSINLGYSFNPRISLRSITTFTERQLKSAGSFMPNIRFKGIKMDTHSEKETRSSNLRNNIYELTIGPSYFYIYVINQNFFAAIGANVGAGIAIWNSSTQQRGGITLESTQTTFAYRWDGKAGLGYNGRSFFGGIYVSMGDLYFNQQGVNQNMQQDFQAYFQVLFGIRLESPKWLKKQMAKLDEIIEM